MKLTNAQIYTLRRLSGGSKYQLRGDGKRRGNAGQDQGYSPMIFLHHLFLSCFVSGWWTMYIWGERTRLVLCGHAYRHGETSRCHHEYQGLIFHNEFVSSKEKQRVLNV